MTLGAHAAPGRILVTGATGYVGGRLFPALERQGHRVRCLVRRPTEFRHRAGPGTEVVAGDVLDPGSLAPALAGVRTAYYLVHSMEGEGAFADTDRAGARNFARAAQAAGVRRLIYLGGLAQGDTLSTHLDSRLEVGQILRDSGVPTIEFRASIILGSGSASFEMIRALVETLPVMVTPRWVETRTQPIGIEDVIAYLTQALALPGEESRVLEIAGPDRVSYADLMREYGRQRGLRRVMIRVPVLTPKLSGLWLGLVTPVYARIGRAMVDSLRNETVQHDTSALSRFPIRPLGVPAAIARALINEDREFAETRWSDALSSVRSAPSYGGMQYGRRLVDARSVEVPVSPAQAFAPIRQIGGRRGWYHATILWRLRGALDLLVGGAGLRRGRRDPEHLIPGDTLDFWRVEAYEPEHLLRLSAEMKVPGRAWLQFEVRGGPGQSTILQTAIFDPVGLSGQLYWYALWPLHQYVFGGMLRAIGRRASAAATGTVAPPDRRAGPAARAEPGS